MSQDLGIAASDAHGLARITYRQLDHWARQGWVRPTVDAGEGRAGKRLYAAADVVHLDLLRHLAISRINMANAGPRVAPLDIPPGDIRVLWGPVGGREADEPGLVAVPAREALASVEAGGAWVVYNPAGVRARLATLRADVRGSVPRPSHVAVTERRRPA